MNESKIKQYVIFSQYAYGLPIAYKLQCEGKNVVVGLFDDFKSVGESKPEKPEERKKRLKVYDGLLNVQKGEKLMEMLLKVKNKDEYFIFFDLNSLHIPAEKLLKAGFKNGLFPTKDLYELEKNRNAGKDFVKKNYPDVEVAEVTEFKTIEEGIEYINESSEFYALKGNDPDAMTVVPHTKNIDHAKEELISMLRSGKASYEKGGFILECQIRDGIETCPQIVFYNGEPIYTQLDIENKSFGDNNIGIKLSCMQNVIIDTPLDAEINRIGIPPVVYEMAKKQPGIFVWDANLILKDNKFYYLEFCANRFGYDSIFSEMEMSGGASEYFECLMRGENPLKKKYGVAVRGINMHREDNGELTGDMSIKYDVENEPHIWVYMMRKDKENKLVNTEYWMDLVVFTEASDDVEYAIMKCYDVIDEFSFDEMYVRSQADFMSCDYSSSILNRLQAIQKYTEPQQVE